METWSPLREVPLLHSLWTVWTEHKRNQNESPAKEQPTEPGLDRPSWERNPNKTKDHGA